MTKRELVIRALTHRETPTLPYHIEFTGQAPDNLIAYTGDPATKEKYGDKLSFRGAISTQACLPFATPEGVRKEAKRVADILRKDGGYIIAPTHAIAFDVPPENIMAPVEVFHDQEKYLK